MRNDIPSGVYSDLLTGNVARYAKIVLKNGIIKYISSFSFNVYESWSGAFARAPFGRMPFASSTPGSVVYAEPIVSSWGKRTFSGDPSAGASGDIIPTIERTISLVNTERSGWIGSSVIDGSLVGSTISFYVRSKTTGETWLEDILTIVEPLNISSTRCDLSITGVSIIVKYANKFIGNYNSATGTYDSIVLGSLDERTGEDDSSSSSPYTTISSTALQGQTNIIVPSGTTTSFPSSGSLFINGEEFPYSSKDDTHFYLTSPLSRQHDSDSFVGLKGGTYYYKYGAGPITGTGTVLTTNGEYYTNQYILLAGQNPVKCSFQDSFPYNLIESTSEFDSTRTIGISDFTETGGDINTSFVFSDVINYTGRQELASTDWIDIGDEITIPPGAQFVSVTVRIQVTLYKVSLGETQTMQISDSVVPDDMSLPVNLVERVPGTGFYKFSENVGSPYNQWVNFTAGGPSLSVPSGWTFQSGNVNFKCNLYNRGSSDGRAVVYNGNNGIYYYASSSSNTEYNVNVNLNLNTLGSSSDFPFGVKLYWKAYNSSTLGDVIAYFYHYDISATLIKSNSGECHGILSGYIFGTPYEWSASNGDLTINKEYTSTDINDITGDKNKIFILCGSTLAPGTIENVAKVASIKYVIKYKTDTPGYPKYDIIAPEDTRLISSEPSSDVTPMSVLRSVLFGASVPVSLGDSIQIADDYYNNNNLLCNGYFDGNIGVLEVIREISRQCMCFIFEQAGMFEAKIRGIKELEPHENVITVGEDEILYAKEYGIDIELQSISDIVNSIDCSYNADYLLNYSSTLSYSYLLNGEIESKPSPALLSLIDSSVFAEKVIITMVQRNCLPGLIVTFYMTPVAAKLNFGDIVNIPFGGYCGLDHVRGEVVSIETEYESTNGETPLIYKVVAFCLGSAVSSGQNGTTSDTMILSEDSLNDYNHAVTEETVSIDQHQQEHFPANRFATQPFGRLGFAANEKTKS